MENTPHGGEAAAHARFAACHPWRKHYNQAAGGGGGRRSYLVSVCIIFARTFSSSPAFASISWHVAAPLHALPVPHPSALPCPALPASFSLLLLLDHLPLQGGQTPAKLPGNRAHCIAGRERNSAHCTQAGAYYQAINKRGKHCRQAGCRQEGTAHCHTAHFLKDRGRHLHAFASRLHGREQETPSSVCSHVTLKTLRTGLHALCRQDNDPSPGGPAAFCTPGSGAAWAHTGPKLLWLRTFCFLGGEHHS